MVDNDLPGTIIICKNLFLVLLSFVCHCCVVAVYTAEADLVSRYHGKGEEIGGYMNPSSETGLAIETRKPHCGIIYELRRLSSTDTDTNRFGDEFLPATVRH